MAELVRLLKPHEPAIDLMRLALFGAFITLGLRAAHGGGSRRRADVLIAYVLAVSFAVGLVQQESWPFTNWALVHGRSPQRMRSWEMEGIDARGRSWVLDPRIVQPMAPEDFGSWMFNHLGRLDAAGRDRVGRFLLARAEQARLRVRGGRRAAPNERLMGPLAAPHHFTMGRRWSGAADVPDVPFTGLRVWELSWDVEERLADEGRVERRVLFELSEASGA